MVRGPPGGPTSELHGERQPRSLLTRADGTETIIGLKQLDDFFQYDANNPGPRVTQITVETGRKFAKERREKGKGNAAINRSLACSEDAPDCTRGRKGSNRPNHPTSERTAGAKGLS